MEEKTVYILRGLPASGKSTWAKEWSDMDPENRIIISKDGLREMFGKYWVPQRESLVNETFFNMFFYLGIYSKCDIALDTTGLNDDFLNRVERYVEDINRQLKKTLSKEKYQYHIEYLNFFSISVEECIKRDKKRERPVGERIIMDFYKKYKHIIDKG